MLLLLLSLVGRIIALPSTPPSTSSSPSSPSSSPTVEQCPSFCNDGKACKWDVCKNCFFYCGGVCEFGKNNWGRLCKKTCKFSDCSTDSCKGCLFCDGGGFSGGQQPSSCNLPQYTDITSSVFSEATSFNKWFHSGFPYKYYGPPIFVDLDGDGVLDYFNPMHGHDINVDGYNNRMELARGVIEVQGDNPKYKPLLDRVIITDSEKLSIDAHGANILDLDGDGIVDLYISS